jgi:hypothetical protein
MRFQTEAAMPTIYISDSGDDKNDGLDAPKRYGEPACKRATLEAFLVEA